MNEEINEVSVEELAKNHDWVILDVRTDKEWQEGHVSKALHIELGQIPARLDEITKDKKLAVICRSGQRSHRAALFLKGHGYDAFNVKGGMIAWTQAHLPIVTGEY